ncbi:MAG: NAD(P)H-hydrate dehydratase [Bacteroidota bacterium]
MKLLTAQQIKDWDAYTIMHEPVTSLDLMERAASRCANEIELFLQLHQTLSSVVVCCGPGNNGGDGLVIARLLFQKGIQVSVILLNKGAKTTADFDANRERLPEGLSAIEVVSQQEIPVFTKEHLVVDALFGSGLNRVTEGVTATLIDLINESEAYVVAVDIPSGLPAEVNDVEEISNRSIIEADCTLTFQVPRKSFMHAECYDFTGDVKVLDIELHNGFLSTFHVHDFYITEQVVRSILKPRSVFSHKGTFGHVLIAAGSYGKIGAAILASKAALRTGCGLVSAFIPKVGYTIMQTALPEVMVFTDDEIVELRNFPQTDLFSSVGVGPGIGTNEYTQKGLMAFLKQIHQPVVLDADALNILATVLPKQKDFIFPKQCIITPHPKEFDRLAGHCNNSFERLHKQRAFAQRHQITVVLKGAHTSIATPDGRTYFNSSGNPALATAGSGDVLTGIITSLLAQQYSPEEAAVTGVYLHGLCANMWVEEGNHTMIASDIIEMIPQALQAITHPFKI